MPKVIFYAIATILLLAVFPLPYGLYTFVRIVSTIGFGWLAYLSYLRKEQAFAWCFAMVAVLFNPLIPIYLSKEIWFPIDIAAAIGMLLASRKYSR